MTFTLKITCNNAAFSDGDHAREIARILAKAATLVQDGCRAAGLMDVNGNRVGSYVLKGGR